MSDESDIVTETPVVQGTAAAATPATPLIQPLKIKSITLCDFRAFAGPEPIKIELDSKNLLVYGENGAGKSSIFHALNEFFSVALPTPSARQQRLRDLKNAFSRPDIDPFIEVELDDGAPAAKWTMAHHPVDIGSGGADSRIVSGAYRKAILDYRSLLDTNYRYGDGEVNLFDVCINVLLRDYPAIHNGRDAYLFDLWRDLNDYIAPQRHRRLTQTYRDVIASLSSSFNQGLQQALQHLRPLANTLLNDLGWDDIQLSALSAPGIAYNNAESRKDRAFQDCVVRLSLTIGTYSPPIPQTFLNEARLSAIAIAIYLAGRQLCANTLQSNTPRLIVLDDVLIGLDQSNRLPILDVLAKHFKDWQVILLTYDRVWFEMARAYHRRHTADKFWRYAKTHANYKSIAAPTVTAVSSSAASETLDNARKFLTSGHINAAGNYARIAAELALREFCEEKKIPIAYRQDPDKIPANDLLTAAKVFSTSKSNGLYDSPLAGIDMYSSILLNQLSHGGVPTVTRHEVQAAINAVEAVLFAVRVMPTRTSQIT